jgi:hypothetical protein
MAEGFKAFVAATVLDAADLTDFCSSQAVMRFANAAGRDAALTVSIVKEGMFAYLKDTNVLQVNTDSTTTGWVQVYPVITAGITDGQVTNAKLANDSVASANIIAATIVSGDIAAGTITGSNIAASTIGGVNIASNTVTSANILDGTIVGGDIAASTITGSNIAANTVTGSNILDGSITAADLAAGTAVTNLGFTPVQQGGGTGQATNKVYIGWNGAANLLLQVDSTNFGLIWPINISGYSADSSRLEGYLPNFAASVDTVPVRDIYSRIYAGGFVTDDSSPNQFYNNGTHTQIGQFTARVVNASTVYTEAVTSARAVLINSAGTLGTSVSSRRYKVDIEPLQADTDKILQLEPVTFYYLPEMYEPDQDKHLEVGLIAEEAADLGLEQLIHRNAEGEPEAIDYEKLAVYLLKVCKTQQTQIDTLAGRLDKLGA